MWKLFGNIFNGLRVTDIIDKADDWNLTSEEKLKYRLEWLRTIPTGFQLAQRFIGIAFTTVFLIMVLVSFVLLCFGIDIEMQMTFIQDTMVTPITVIFSLFFGGGVVDSIKRKREVPTLVVDHTDDELEEELSKRDKRRLKRAEKLQRKALGE